MKQTILIALIIFLGLNANAGNNCSFAITKSNDTSVNCADSVRLTSSVHKYYTINNLNDDYIYGMAGYSESEDTFAVINNNHIYISTDGGITISKKTLQNSLSDIRFQKFGNTLVFSDQESLIYKTTDWGKTWDSLSISGFQTITMLDLKNFYGLTWDSFYSSNNAGKSWDKVSMHNAKTTNEIAFFLNNNKGFLIEQGQILMTTDGGKTWNSTFSNNLLSVGSFYFLDDNIGFLQSNYLYGTTDGGLTWSIINNVYFPAAFAIDNDTLYYAESNGDISKSIDKGKTWTKIITAVVPVLDYMLVKNGVFTFFDNTGNVFRSTKSINYEWSYNNSIIATKSTCNVKVLNDGIYNIKVSDNNGCMSTASVNVHSNFIVQSITNQIVSCGDSVHLKAQIPFWRKPTILTQSSSFGYTTSTYNIFTNDSIGYIFTESAGLMKTTDAGNSWKLQSDDYITYYINAGFFTQDTGWIVGEYGRIAKSIDGGKTWVSKPSSVTATLFSISIPDKTYSIVVGDSGLIVKSTDNGETWRKIISGDTNRLMSVVFVTPKTGFVVGDKGTILRTDDKGEHWFVQKTNSTEYLTSVFFTDSLHGVVVGTNGHIEQTIDGGKNWVVEKSQSTNKFWSVWFADSLNGYAAGTDIVYTNDGGTTWIKELNPSGQNIYNIAGNNKGSIIAVGTNGTILKYNPAGNVQYKWTDAKNTILSQTDACAFKPQSNNIVSILSTNDKGCATTTQDTVLIRGLQYTIETPKETTCGNGLELSLSNLTYLKTFNNGIISVNFTNNKTGLLVSQGDSIYQTHDGGMHWVPFQLPIDSIYYVYINQKVVFLVNDSIGFVSGISFKNNKSYLYKTINDGKTWGTIDSLQSYIDYSVVSGKIYLVSNNSIKTSIDTGKTWIIIANPSTNTIIKLNVLNADTCVILDSKGKCYISIDGCKTWNYTATISAFSGSVDWIKIFDKNHIYAASYDQLARSNDFGKTWNIVTCINYTTQNIAFTDNDNGFCINNNILYTTHDGGNTWDTLNTIVSKNYRIPGPLFVVDRNTIFMENSVDLYEINLNLYKNFKWTSVTDGLLGSSPQCIAYPKHSSEVIFEASINDYCALKDTISVKISPLIVDLGNDKVGYPQQEIVLQAYSGNTNKTERILSNNNSYNEPNTAVAFSTESYGISNDFMGNTFVTNDSSNTWNPITINSISKIQYLNNDLGLALSNSQLYKVFNSGYNWLPIGSPYLSQNDFIVTKDGTLFTVSNFGLMYKSDNIGKSWTRLDSSNHLYNFMKIQFCNNDTGYVLISDSGVIKTSDKGKTWQTETNFPKNINNFYLFDSIHAIALSSLNWNAWYTSNDGYKTWVYHENPQLQNLHNIQFYENICYVNSIFDSTYFSKDFGNTWQTTHTTSLYVMNSNVFYYNKANKNSIIEAKEDIPANYSWSSSIKGFQKSDSSMIRFKPASSGYVYVTATTNNGCVGNGSVYVAVIDSNKIDLIDSIRINPATITLNRNRLTDTVHVSVYQPINTQTSNLYWTYSDNSIFFIQNDSILQPQKVGSANAFIINDEGVTSNVITVTIGCDIVNSLSISKEMYGFKGGSSNIYAYTNISNSNQCIKWRSTDTSIVKVDSIGNVKFLKDGIALVIAATIDDGLTDTCIVYVGCNITSLLLPQTEMIYTNEYFTLGVSSNQTDVTGCVQWSTQNPFIATVDNYGHITIVDTGTTIINVSSLDNKIWSSCILTIVNRYVKSNEIKTEHINLYPNPSNNSVTISTDDNKAWKAVLYNSNGDMIQAFDLLSKETQITTKALPSGLYFITVKNDKEIKTMQLSVQH